VPETTKSSVPAKVSDWDKPGTKKWRWGMRLINVMLFILPGYPLLGVIGTLADPKIQVSAKRAGIEADTSQGTVTSVLVELRDPTWLDYLLLAGPWIAGLIAVSFACRALYRIDINFNGNQNPYTERDFKMLKRADLALGLMMLPILFALFAGMFRYRGASADLMLLLFMGVMLGTALSYTTKMYVKGKSFYEELEKGV
jgi:hypothetical protein